mmetsp:Transcript_57141/g.107467  ORF Transcript_57141/g.107467 Transcript_57141/m.107467 type:complete len:84 (-) Transcript_57141:511-762(-)
MAKRNKKPTLKKQEAAEAAQPEEIETTPTRSMSKNLLRHSPPIASPPKANQKSQKTDEEEEEEEEEYFIGRTGGTVSYNLLLE